MALTNTFKEKVKLMNGLVLEYGTWTEGAAGTSGTIVCETSNQPEVGNIIACGFASDGDTAVDAAIDQARTTVKITYTAGDSGDYWILGKSA